MILALLTRLAAADQPPFPIAPELAPVIRPHAGAERVAPRGFRRSPLPAQLPPPQDPPQRIVYGYQPYWVADSASLPWDQLTHVAIFSAGVNADGTLSDTSRLDEATTAVAAARPYGAKVHLCFTSFDADDLATLLGSASNRARLITGMRAQVDRTGAHGVNIDFEGVPASRKTQLVAFAAEVAAEFGDEVVFASPAVDWQGAWDYSELTRHAYLFIMGYDYYWAGSDYAGPNDPLYSTNTFGQYALEWTVTDYLTWDADPARTILGLPLYGRYWRTSNADLHAPALADGETVTYADMLDEIATHGERWESGSHSAWVYRGTGQSWAPNERHVTDRAQYAVDAGLAGFGFWALQYDANNPDLWATLGEISRPDDADVTPDEPATDVSDAEDTDDGGTSTVVEEEPGDPNWEARAGAPVIARVGDQVILSAKGSKGPEGVDKRYRWRQTAGPAVELAEANTARPSFVIPAVGTYLFEVRVGDGDAWSSWARSYVVVPNPNAGRQFSTGCDQTGVGGVALTAALAALTTRRRRT